MFPEHIPASSTCLFGICFIEACFCRCNARNRQWIITMEKNIFLEVSPLHFEELDLISKGVLWSFFWSTSHIDINILTISFTFLLTGGWYWQGELFLGLFTDMPPFLECTLQYCPSFFQDFKHVMIQIFPSRFLLKRVTSFCRCQVPIYPWCDLIPRYMESHEFSVFFFSS